MIGGKLGKSTEEKERKSIQAAVESYYALPGVPDEECLASRPARARSAK